MYSTCIHTIEVEETAEVCITRRWQQIFYFLVFDVLQDARAWFFLLSSLQLFEALKIFNSATMVLHSTRVCMYVVPNTTV